MTTFVGAMSPVFDTDAILDALRERVEMLIEAFSPEEPSRVELRPRGDGEERVVAGAGEKRWPDPKARDAAKKALAGCAEVWRSQEEKGP